MGRRHFHPLPTSLLTLFLAAPHRRTGQCFGRQLSQRGRPSSTPYNPGRKRQEWGVGFPSLWQHPASHPITNTLWLRWIISELEIPPTSLLENLLCAGLGIKKKKIRGEKSIGPYSSLVHSLMEDAEIISIYCGIIQGVHSGFCGNKESVRAELGSGQVSLKKWDQTKGWWLCRN